MSPRPSRLDGADMSAGGPVNLVSPTGITHSISRPKAQRSTENKKAGTSGGFLAAESFHFAYHKSGKDPKVRRRTEYESSSEANVPALCAPMHVRDFMDINRNASACVNKTVVTSKEYAAKYGPPAKEHLSRCVDATASGMTEAVLRTGDLYDQRFNGKPGGCEQTCFSNMDAEQDQLRTANSMIESSSASGSPESFGEKRKRSKSQPSKFRSPRFPDAAVNEMMRYPGEEGDHNISPPPKLDRMDTSRWNEMFSNPQPATNRSSHNDLREARLQLLKVGESSDMTETEARLVRALENINRQDQAIVRLTSDLEESKAELEATRQKLDESQNYAQKRQFAATEVRARAVQDRKKIEDLFEKEVQQNRKLEAKLAKLQVEASGLKRALRSARSDGVNKAGTSSPRSTSSSPRHFTNTRDQDNRSRDSPPGEKYSAEESSQLIALRAEVVELKSLLAEARAVKLQDDISTHSGSSENEELRRQIREMESTLEDYIEKEIEFRKQEDRHIQTENIVREKLRRLEDSSKETVKKAEEKIKEAVAAEQAARSELSKVKNDVHRLERERNSHRLKASAETERLTKQIAKAKEETQNLKQQMANEQMASKEEIEKLNNEIMEYKVAISKANQGALLKGTEYIKTQRKLQKDIARQNQEAKAMQDKIESQEEKIEHLEKQLKDNERKMGEVAMTSQKVAQLEEELILSQDNEARLRRDLDLQRMVLHNTERKAEERIKAQEKEFKEREDELARQIKTFKDKVANLEARRCTKIATPEETCPDEFEVLGRDVEYLPFDFIDRASPRNRNDEELKEKIAENSRLRAEMDQLKDQLAAAEASNVDRGDSPDILHQAKEQALLNEICVLKAQLAEAETQRNEEIFRTDEIRRGGHDFERNQFEDVERRQERKQRAADAERTLQTTLSDMRQRSAPSETLDREVPMTDYGIPPRGDRVLHGVENSLEVKQLRQELAITRARLASLGAGSPMRKSWTNSQPPPSPDGSASSRGSSWAPPVLQMEGMELQSSSDSMGGMTPNSSMSPRTSQRVDVAALQRKLRESSKRLSDANTKLKGLVQTSDSIMEEHLRMRTNCTSILTMVRKSASSDEPPAGFVDEVMTSPSGSIEVSERRYANI